MSSALLSYLLPRRHAKMRIGLHTDLSHHIPSITNLVSSHLLSVVAHVVVFFVQVLAWDLLLQRFPFSRLLLFSLSRHASLLSISEVGGCGFGLQTSHHFTCSFRRWILSCAVSSLRRPVSAISSSDFVTNLL